MSPNAGGGGWVARVSANEYSCAHGGQIYFGDLTPYLTHDCQVHEQCCQKGHYYTPVPFTPSPPTSFHQVIQTHIRIICAGIFKQSMGARNRVGIELSYRPTRLHTTQPGGVGSLKSILGLIESLKFGLWYLFDGKPSPFLYRREGGCSSLRYSS